MLNSIGRTLLRGLIAVATLSPLSLSTGCADVLTYSRRYRTEGLSLYRQQAYPDAAGAFRNAVRQDPRDYESHYWLAQSYIQMGLYQQAFSSYRAALDILPATYGGRNDPEFKKVVLDGYAHAIAQYDKRDIELNELEQQAQEANRSQEWFVLAKVYRLRGDADSAIRAYRAATHWDPNNFALRKEFGLYLYDTLRQNNDARYQLGLAYRLNPNDKEVVAALRQMGVLPPPAQTPSQAAATPSMSAPRD